MNTPGTDIRNIAQAICAKQKLTLGSEVGSGTFKTTYRTVDEKGTALALKLVLGGRVERLQREIEAISRCRHPNIGKLIGVGEDTTEHGRVIYLVEPFLEGGTLADRLNGAVLNPADVRDLAKQLSSALVYLAELDLVHRDIKPANIMFHQDLQVPILVDFGLVRDLSKESLTATHLARGPGTPLFAPPEQLQNQKELIDWRSDQFALGTTLAVAAFAKHPYARGSDGPLEAIDRVTRREAPSPDFEAAAKSANLEPIVQMVRPYPVQRFCFPKRLTEAWS